MTNAKNKKPVPINPCFDDFIDVNSFDPADHWQAKPDAPFVSHAENMSYSGEETGVEVGVEKGQ